MSKIYLTVRVIPYEGDTVLGVYHTRDDAEAAAKAWWTADRWNAMDDLWVSEYVVGAEPGTDAAASWRVKS